MTNQTTKDLAKNLMDRFNFYEANKNNMANLYTRRSNTDYTAPAVNKFISPGKIIPVRSKMRSSTQDESEPDVPLNAHTAYAGVLGHLSTKCKFYPGFCTEFLSKNHLKFEELLSKDSVDVKALRQAAWNGVPMCCRLRVWKILSGFFTVTPDRDNSIMKEKQTEYSNYVKSYFEHRNSGNNVTTFRQICLDVPRTYPLLPIFQVPVVQKMYERVLYIWSIRHPASGYVQGINDLLGPFLFAALFPFFGNDSLKQNPSELEPGTLEYVESDIFWLLTKLLDKVINNYTPDQPGIQNKIRKILYLISKFDGKIFDKLETLSSENGLFCFKWINNLFVRDFPFNCTIRLWDTLWAQDNGFDDFIVYVCAAIFKTFSRDIMMLEDNMALLMFMQSLPTQKWLEEDMSMLLAEAFLLHERYSIYVSKVK